MQKGKSGSFLKTLLDQGEFLPQSSVMITSIAIKADLKSAYMDSSSFRSNNTPNSGL